MVTKRPCVAPRYGTHRARLDDPPPGNPASTLIGMAMSASDPQPRIVENYRAFAREAHGKSPRYEALATSVAADTMIISFLTELPGPKRQPNLLFAAACYLLGEHADIETLQADPEPRR
jgi:hypothetical protein